MTKQTPIHTADHYRAIAAQYAEMVDEQPMNAYYERPATLSLLPPLAGTAVLDAACGPGWYTEYLLGQGAHVTAFDIIPHFVELTKMRVGDEATVVQADLSQPLRFAATAAFDLVICPLALHYLRDWSTPLREFHRVLKPHGRLVFSTHHPFKDWQSFETDNYFRQDLLDDVWEIGPVQFYRRPLTAMSKALHSAGFVIDYLLEPQPTADFRRANPKRHEHLLKNPWFLHIRATKTDN